MMLAIIILSIFTIYGATNFMIARKTLAWLLTMWPSLSPFVFYAIYSIFALSVIISFVLPARLVIRKYIFLFSYYWMGIYFYLLIAIPVSMIVPGLCFHLGFISPDFQRQAILAIGWIISLTIFTILIYGRVNALEIKLATYEVKIRKQSSISGLKIALISDIHLNIINNYEHLNKIVKKINCINPDIVCFGGDIFDGDYNIVENPEKTKELLSSIQPKYGTYACLGNHDAGKTYPKMIEFLEKSSVCVLYDEYVVVENQFIIAGRRDSFPIGYQGEKRAQLPSLDIQYKDLPVIVLDHQPSNINEYNSDIDLVLCGHTHGGQVFPANHITNAIFDVDYGYYQKDQSSPHVVVTSGAGTWGPPFRISTCSEVVCISVLFDFLKEDSR